MKDVIEKVEGYNFNKLTPRDDVDCQVYNEAFRFIFLNDDILNIALTGPYSSGKSSVFITYENSEEGKTKKYIHISLADFSSSDKKNNEESDLHEETTKLENQLEGRIINQLLHQIDEEKIKDSRFKTKKRKNINSLAKVFEIFILIWAGFLAFCQNQMKDWFMGLYEAPLDNLFPIMFNPYISVIIIVSAVTLILYEIFQLLEHRNMHPLFQKIEFHGTSLELFPKENDSIFDKYMDEIIYILENADVDVVVFEDLDRYEDVEIFKRLREINWLLNKRIQYIEDRRIIRFFYLIKDDIFQSGDRTKFFDFIIPIVPVVSGYNAYDKMLEYLSDGRVVNKVDKDFIRGLCVFVDEKRLLDNIYNEFLIYSKQLNSSQINYNYLLALIAYKNIFPRDFNCLYMGKGFLNDIFACKKKIIGLKKSIVISEINEKCKIVVDKENSKDNEEQIMISKDEIEKLNDKKNKFDAMNMSELIEDDEKIFWDIVLKIKTSDFDKNSIINNKYKDIIGNEKFALIQYLLREGKINEGYKEYINVFYGKYMSSNDREFINSTYESSFKGYDFKLNNLEEIVKELEEKRFERKEILNYQLLEYLLKSRDKNQNKLRNIITTIKQNDKLDFLEGFFVYTGQRESLVRTLNKYWRFYFDDILDTWKDNHIRDISLLIIKYLDKKSLREISERTRFREYISNQSDYLLYITDVDKQLEALKIVGVSFINIANKKYKKEVLKKAYGLNLYDIQLPNLKLMLDKIEKVPDVKYAKGNIVSCVLSLNSAPIRSYCLENYNQFLTVLINEKYIFRDNDNTILHIVNADEISDEIKSEYIVRLKSRLKDVSKVIKPNLVKDLIVNRRVEYKAENVLYYYLNFGWDSELVEFINSDKKRNLYFSNCKKYVESKLAEGTIVNPLKFEKQRDCFSELFEEIVKSKELSEEKYETILKKYGWWYNDFTITDISKEKMEILLRNNIIKFNENSIDSIRKYYPDYVVEFVKLHIDDYVDSVINGKIEPIEIVRLLQFADSILSEENKLKMLSCSNDVIRLDNSYPDAINNEIIKNHFSNEDLSVVFKLYSAFNSEIKAIIIQKAINNLKYIINGNYKLDDNLISDLIEHNSLTLNNKQSIVKANIANVSNDNMNDFLSRVGYEEIGSTYSSKRLPVKLTDDNLILLELMKANGRISRYDIDKEKGLIKGIRIKNNNTR